MKLIKIGLLLSLLTVNASQLTSFTAPRATFDGKSYDKKQQIDITLSTDQEIADYYGDYSSIENFQLKNYLYSVIKDMYTETTYDEVSNYLKITDRNWDLYDESKFDPSTFTFKKAKETNDWYTDTLYFADRTTPSKQINNNINGFASSADGVGNWDNKVRPKGAQVDKEHVWPKSRGFATESANGAHSDMHHLISGDGPTNQQGHSDECYGEVVDKTAKSTKEIYAKYFDGTTGLSGWTGLDANGENVFEPIDDWKGDIARALFYMDTRYSNSSNPTSKEPYLQLIDGEKGDNFDPKAHYKGNTGIHHNLSTMIKWHSLDPVDNYEYRRNDLIYKNVTKNRNPYIDYPSLVYKVYGGSLEELSKDISLKVDKTFTFPVNNDAGTEVTMTSSDEKVISVNKDDFSIKALKAGVATVTITGTFEGVEKTYTFTITVTKNTQNPFKDLTLNVNGFQVLNIKNDENTPLTITSSDTNIVAVDDKKLIIMGLKVGAATITIVGTFAEEEEAYTFKVTVVEPQDSTIGTTTDNLPVNKLKVNLVGLNETADFKLTKVTHFADGSMTVYAFGKGRIEIDRQASSYGVKVSSSNTKVAAVESIDGKEYIDINGVGTTNIAVVEKLTETSEYVVTNITVVSLLPQKTMIIIGVSLGVVVLIIAIVVLVIVLNKKKKKNTKPKNNSKKKSSKNSKMKD